MDSSKKATQIYRSTTLGRTLQEAVEELVGNLQLSAALGQKVIDQFDRTMCYHLEKHTRSRYQVKGALDVYRYCDAVWTLILKDAEFHDINHSSQPIKCDRVRVVAIVDLKSGAGAAAAADALGAERRSNLNLD